MVWHLVIFCIIFIIMFAVYSETCLPAAAAAANQFIFIVMPSIFPFCVISEILLRTGFINKLGEKATVITRLFFNISGEGAFAVILGLVSGYPAGARLSGQLYEMGEISRKEAEHLSAFTNNCGPLFLIGAVGAGMLNSWKIGLYLWICHAISAILTGIFLRFFYRQNYITLKNNVKNKNTKKISIGGYGKIFSDAVSVSIMNMIPIGGFIIFFAVFSAVLMKSGLIPLISSLGGKNFSGLLTGAQTGFLEITSGISKICGISNISNYVKFPAISMIAGWAGISVHTQVIGILSKAKISSRPYIKGKVIQSIIAAILSALSYPLVYRLF